MRILNVAEKNDAAKSIAALLSGGRPHMRQGLSQYNKVYEFECEVQNRNSKMIMTSVSGHLLSYDFMPAYRNWETTDPAILFDAPIHQFCPPNNEACMKNLQKEVKMCSMLIIWTDCDREGENIGYEIIDVCQKANPNITVHRARFSEITAQSVRRALNNLDRPNPDLNNAVKVRRELDLRIGAAFTRFQCLNLRRAFPTALKDSIVSYGSCQFPTLGFVVERFKAISEFRPEPFWKIEVTHKIDDLAVNFLWKRHHLFEKLPCEVLYDKCQEAKEARVTKVESKPKTKWRPKPLDTIELEKLGSRKLKINAKETLKIAERLYTKGFISYPRTETNVFSKEINLVSLVQQQTSDPNWGDFAQQVLANGPNPNQGKKLDQAHPPIHPIRHATNELTGNDRRVYELIVRHFLACLSKNAEGLETVVDIELGEEEFAASGLMITARNYLDVYPYDKWSDKEIHLYRLGDTFTPDIGLAEGETSPPSLLTEADLIALMEKHGIGTDATHAEHIETIKSRFYVGLQNDKFFVPRTLGMGLVEGYCNMGYEMAKPELRASLEADLKRISDGAASPDEVLTRYINDYRDIYTAVHRQMNRLSETIQSYIQVEAVPVPADNHGQLATSNVVKKCGSCNAPMTLRTAREKTFVSCTNYPVCKEAIWIPGMVKEVTLTEDTCPTCGPDVRLLKFNFERGSCYLPTTYVGCVGGCDPNLLGILRSNSRAEAVRGGGEPRQQQPQQHQQQRVFRERNNVVDESRKCRCDLPAVRLVVSKPGPNCGRVFYKCSAPRDGHQCDYFEWEGNASRGRGDPVAQPDDGTENEIRCFCAMPSKRFTVSKDGPNRGKAFYSCGRNMRDSEKCNFFQWAT